MGSLFSADDDSTQNAYLDRLATPWCLYRDGYQEAAFLLIERSETFDRRNTLIYPILFLFRHHIELCLKEFILDGKRGIKKPGSELNDHNLKNLWKVCEEIIRERHLPITADELKIIKSGVEDFNHVDSQSYAFRYPVDKKGADSLPNRSDPISIRELKGTMESLTSCLKRLIDLLAIDSDMRREFQEIKNSWLLGEEIE
jgi:hypothetical protein